jgi:hypothetical protein
MICQRLFGISQQFPVYLVEGERTLWDFLGVLSGGKSPSLRRALFPLPPRSAFFGVLSPVNETRHNRLRRGNKGKIRQIKDNLPDFSVKKTFV